MAQKRKRNLPTKKSVATSQRLLGKDSFSNFKVANYLVNSSSFEIYEDTDISHQILLEACTTIVIVHILAQIRFCDSSAKPEALDKRGSCKFFKKKFIASNSGRIFATALAVSQPEVIQFVAEEENLVSWLNNVIYSYIGNERKLTNCTKENCVAYVHGSLSRIIGLLNSCPSTSVVSLGINPNSVSWSISDVLNSVDYEKIKEFPSEEVKENILNIAFEGVIKDEDFNQELNFEESPLAGSAINGITPLESEIFGENFIRSFSTPSKPKSSNIPVIYSRDQLDGLIPLIQIKKYEAFSSFKNWDKVRDMNIHIESLLPSEEEEEGSDSDKN